MEDFEFGEAEDGDEDGDDAFGQYIDQGKTSDEGDPFITVEPRTDEDDPFASAPDPILPIAQETEDF